MHVLQVRNQTFPEAVGGNCVLFEVSVFISIHFRVKFVNEIVAVTRRPYLCKHAINYTSTYFRNIILKCQGWSGGYLTNEYQ